ncbi:MAG TPA: AAA family ATPase [Ornithinicoccus sp.]|nr:AAA family ATPase [Ornithinicoccus sp.]
MTTVLLTGMSGTGKSTVLARLRELGHAAVDIDDEGLLDESGEEALWDEDGVERVLATSPRPLFLAGCAANQGRFYPDLTHVVLLSAPADVVRERLATRTTNPFGRTPEELARVLADLAEVEPLLRRGATLEVDTSRASPEEVVRLVLDHAGLATPPTTEETR